MSKFNVMLDQVPSTWITADGDITAYDHADDIALSAKPAQVTIARTIQWGQLMAHMLLCKRPFWPFRNKTAVKAHHRLLSWDIRAPLTIPNSGSALILPKSSIEVYTSTILDQCDLFISGGRPIVLELDDDLRQAATIRSVVRVDGRNPRLMLEVGDIFDLRQVFNGEVQIIS